MSSILTNTSSMVALQTLKNINGNMGKVQNEISTGMKVATAKDNSSNWAIATRMSSDVASYTKLAESLGSSMELVGTARTAAESIASELEEIQKLAIQAREPGADLVKLQADTDARLATIVSTAASAQYNGINLVKTGPDSANVVVSIVRTGAALATTGSSTLAVAGVDLQAVGAAVTLTAGDDTALAELQTRLTTVTGAAASFGAAQIRIEGQSNFLGKQIDALKNGVGAIVDADMEEASARLTALQTQQQLGIQSLSIANQAPQSILSLFRG